MYFQGEVIWIFEMLDTCENTGGAHQRQISWFILIVYYAQKHAEQFREAAPV